MTFDSRGWKLAVTGLLIGFIIAATITFAMRSKPTPPPPVAGAVGPAAPDTLDAELDRCSRLGPNDPPDQACLDAWAEARRRFFGNSGTGARR